jgi:large subunit ribosomal protein L29
VKVDELRVLEVDELGVRLKTARRELYELRFKHAVGQLENSSQISKVRHDIARIMTVQRERDFGIVASVPADMISSPLEAGTSPRAGMSSAQPGDGEEQEPIAARAEPAKPKRGRKKKEDAE